MLLILETFSILVSQRTNSRIQETTISKGMEPCELDHLSGLDNKEGYEKQNRQTTCPQIHWCWADKYRATSTVKIQEPKLHQFFYTQFLNLQPGHCNPATQECAKGMQTQTSTTIASNSENRPWA